MSNRHTRSQMLLTAALECETNRIVLPSARNFCIVRMHWCWKDFVADGEHLVQQQHVGIQIGGDGECEPDDHA